MNILYRLLILYHIARCFSSLKPSTSSVHKRNLPDKINFTILKLPVETNTPKIIVKETMIPNNINDNNDNNDKNDNTTSVKINNYPNLPILPILPDACLLAMLII